MFEKVLELNPSFEPAIEALKSLDNYEKLNNRINEMRRIQY